MFRGVPKSRMVEESAVEIGAANRGVEWCGGEAAYGKTGLGCSERIVLVTGGGTGIASGDDNCDAFGSGLFPQPLKELVAGGAKLRFTRAEANAHDGGEIGIDDELRGEDDAISSRGSSGNDEIHRGVFGNRAGPFHIDSGFAFDPRDQAGVGTVVDNIHVLGRKTQESAERIHTSRIDIAFVDDGNRLAGAVNAGIPQRLHVVYRREVAGRDREKGLAVY